MENVPNNTTALLSRIDALRNSLIKRFENLIELAAIENTDRNTTALHTYQVKVETAGLIRASEEVLTLIRRLQELWLFGQLNTLETDQAQHEADEQAKEIADMLRSLARLQNSSESITAA